MYSPHSWLELGTCTFTPSLCLDSSCYACCFLESSFLLPQLEVNPFILGRFTSVLSWLTPPSELRLECAISLSPKISVAILAFISVVVRVNKGLTVGFGCDAEFWF